MATVRFPCPFCGWTLWWSEGQVEATRKKLARGAGLYTQRSLGRGAGNGFLAESLKRREVRELLARADRRAFAAWLAERLSDAERHVAELRWLLGAVA